jgi:hypothetical protein
MIIAKFFPFNQHFQKVAKSDTSRFWLTMGNEQSIQPPKVNQLYWCIIDLYLLPNHATTHIDSFQFLMSVNRCLVLLVWFEEFFSFSLCSLSITWSFFSHHLFDSHYFIASKSTWFFFFSLQSRHRCCLNDDCWSIFEHISFLY